MSPLLQGEVKVIGERNPGKESDIRVIMLAALAITCSTLGHSPKKASVHWEP